MPKRSTLTFSSEDAPPSEEDPLHVYYCKYSGQHCFITGEALGPWLSAPGRLLPREESICLRCAGRFRFLSHLL